MNYQCTGEEKVRKVIPNNHVNCEDRSIVFYFLSANNE